MHPTFTPRPKSEASKKRSQIYPVPEPGPIGSSPVKVDEFVEGEVVHDSPQIEGERSATRRTASDESKFDYLQHSTISRDYTHASQSKGEKLVAIQKGVVSGGIKLLKQGVCLPGSLRSPWLENLVQLNHGLMMARREQDMIRPHPSSTSSDSASSLTTRLARASAHDANVGEFPAAERQPSTGTQDDVLGLDEVDEKILELQRLRASLRSTTVQVFHVIDESDIKYLAAPSWHVSPDDETVTLAGRSPLTDELRFLRQRSEIAFAVYKYYAAEYQAKAVLVAGASGHVLPDPVPIKETIILISDQIREAMNEFRRVHPTFEADFPKWNSKEPIPSPFMFWYRYREAPNIEAMAEHHQQQMRILTDWIEHHYRGVYDEARDKFRNGKVSSFTMPFLVRPGDVLVQHPPEDLIGYVAESWAERVDEDPVDQARSMSKPGGKMVEKWQVKAWTYKSDGHFCRSTASLDIHLEFDKEDEDVEMRDFKVIPLRFAQSDVRDQLAERGRIIWACRHRKFVTYNSSLDVDPSEASERYMIDLKTYRDLHPGSTLFSNSYSKGVPVKMDEDVMKSDEPPQEPDLLVLPSTVAGYNFRQKKWRDLQVDRVQEVVWNKNAFQHLVIDDEIKDIIEALVTSKIDSEQGTDLIQGKGTGLIILLHGSPGTGKTFTAESVAEIAEKPLFRVTCGDIGTKPEQVERYLESVLHLGKIWGCVVLLDEADVFLEQRALTDLERNALVSVFLRVIEYYEGILILTSNRVGTFDEAFKSRILLPLHYKPLTGDQRRRIWENFLLHLNNGKSSEEGDKSKSHDTKKGKSVEWQSIDFEDIRRHLGDLAKVEMNGRQIRNAITTARQLARFKRETMKYKHLEHVIQVTQRFDKYLENERDGMDEETMAWGKGV